MMIDLDAIDSPWFRRFDFPDGQPHYAFDPGPLQAATRIDLIARIRNGGELLNVALALDALRSLFPERMPPLALNIPYLLGARMDRRIAAGQPASLGVVAALLRASVGGAFPIRVLDPHSPVAFDVLPGLEALLPDALVQFALADVERQTGEAPVVVLPDRGAAARTAAVLDRLHAAHSRAQCSKVRDPASGKLSGFKLDAGAVAGRVALIIDDLCDGGRTFTGIAEVLREHGAKAVYLCVTHGVFSKGLVLDGITASYATDSYGVPDATSYHCVAATQPVACLRYVSDGATRLTLLTDYVGMTLRGEAWPV